LNKTTINPVAAGAGNQMRCKMVRVNMLGNVDGVNKNSETTAVKVVLLLLLIVGYELRSGFYKTQVLGRGMGVGDES
jgi:hypothetical protein